MDPDDNEYRWVLAGAAMLTQVGAGVCGDFLSIFRNLQVEQKHEVNYPRMKIMKSILMGFYLDVSGFPSLVDESTLLWYWNPMNI